MTSTGCCDENAIFTCSIPAGPLMQAHFGRFSFWGRVRGVRLLKPALTLVAKADHLHGTGPMGYLLEVLSILCSVDRHRQSWYLLPSRFGVIVHV